jgi:epoxyqueuosine reductase
MNPDALTRELRDRARAEGFDACGLASASRLDRDGAALEAWLANDRHAEMHWMARDPSKRADPRELLPGCNSVVVLAMNYWPGPEDALNPEGSARVALYARGRDYHKVLARKLKRLAAWLDEKAGCVSRVFVDTGPVLERAWAERAKLGWIGKNANLLTRELGSWLLLGEILTTATLEAAAAQNEEFCGTCTACLDACPTGAIVSDGVVDSNLCISYWTIEHRGAIPPARRPGIRDWIFGCDVCQEVCPWNQSFARPAVGDPFSRREDLRGLDPEEVLGLDEATFRSRYSGTSLMRAKWQGMRRNACVVLGNRADAGALPTLALALDDEDAVVASHAAWAVAVIGGPDAARLLEDFARRETRPDVSRHLREGLDRIRGAGTGED